ncbi:MAG: YcjX family protein [Rhizobiales bacterium]|nr:YcjX family protein [Hyphomicrobiales bacterium]
MTGVEARRGASPRLYHEQHRNRIESPFNPLRQSLSGRNGPHLPARAEILPPVIKSVAHAIEQARLAARALAEFGGHLFKPTVRLGVTGLSRAGKTVFITALVHGLMRGGRFPVFEALGSGRIAGARLSPQPDDAVPRFDYETHVRSLLERHWPDSTRQISELRVVIDYQSQSGTARTLTLDLIDYPGEWLLDLPLLGQSYEDWSAESLALSREQPRAQLAGAWHAHLATLDPAAPADEQAVMTAAQLFTAYLKACRDDRFALSLLPPGRFLMPGDLAGSPALTFAPLERSSSDTPPDRSLWAMMRRRYDAYKTIVVRPFFREHFARLDRQIVLVDALAALNAGPAAVCDLERTLIAILDCFQIGRQTMLSALVRPRVDKILFAATKADHLHHANHDRLEAILRRMTERAAERADFAGADIDVIALAAVRATREAQVRRNGETLPSIIGVPAAGELSNGRLFDGATEVAVFPGDLPADPDAVFRCAIDHAGSSGAGLPDETDLRFLRVRPPALQDAGAETPAFPHIRLDRALQFLLGDRLR